jgi:transcriptional regulator with XRE-family HTH domain
MPLTDEACESPTLLRWRLAGELRRLRAAAGLTIEEVATHLCCSTSKVSRVETARVAAMQRDVKDMLELYGVIGQQRDALLTLARQARQKDEWWLAYSDFPNVRTYMSFERAAARMKICQPMMIPGLLQTREYAESIIVAAFPDLGPSQIERLLALRIERQVVLEGNRPPSLTVILDEAALHRLKGRRPLMRKQLQHLIDAAGRRNVTLQILPFSAGPGGGLVESFRILSFPDPADPDLIHLEHQTGDLYLSSEDQLARYSRMFERSRALAFTPERSTAFLAELHRNA